MKYLFIRLNLCALLMFLNLSSSAQGLSVIPSQANSNDSISIIADVIFSAYPCSLDSFSINIIDSTIIVDASYYLGPGQAGCQTRDTLMIGRLNPKRYKLKYYAIDNYTPNNPLVDSLYFNVIQATGINERTNPIQSVLVYPNPSKEAINLKVQLAKAVSTTIRITDVQGKNVHTEQVQLNQGETVHAIKTKKLSSGI